MTSRSNARHMLLVPAFIACAVAAPHVSSLSAQAPTDTARATATARPVRKFCFQGRPMDRCRAFALLELTSHSQMLGSKLDSPATPPGFGYNRWDHNALSTHFVVDIGAMKNLDARTAVGATLTAGALDAGGKLANISGATVRYRRWLTPSVSVDAGTGILRMPVGVVVQTVRENVLRPALVADVRLGFRDLLSATGRFMVATDGQGRTHQAIFIGASSGSKVSAAIAGALVAWVIFLSPRGDKVSAQ